MSMEVRYTEYNGTFTARSYRTMDERLQQQPSLNLSGTLDQRPMWLQVIADVARAGEHFMPVSEPPPDRILWFTVDKNFNLVEIDIFKR